jgi:SOS-response transcriptional repressor LexA
MFMTTSSLAVAMDRACGVRQPSTVPSFTDRQGQYLAFIDAYTRVNGRPPAEADLQRRFAVSAPAAHHMVVSLERAGLIRRQPGVARSIEVLVDPRCLPLLQPPQAVKSSVHRN